MIYLAIFGDDIEDALGPVRFLAFYLLVGVASALIYAFLHTGSKTPLIGASGAISGVLAAYLLLRPCARVSVLVFRFVARVPAYLAIGGWIVLQLIAAVSEADGNVAYSAHLAGLLAGVLLFLALRPRDVRLLECLEQPARSR